MAGPSPEKGSGGKRERSRVETPSGQPGRAKRKGESEGRVRSCASCRAAAAAAAWAPGRPRSAPRRWRRSAPHPCFLSARRDALTRRGHDLVPTAQAHSAIGPGRCWGRCRGVRRGRARSAARRSAGEPAREEGGRRVRAAGGSERLRGGSSWEGLRPGWEKGESRRRTPGGWGEQSWEGLICPPSCSNKRRPPVRSAHARRGRSEGKQAGPRARAQRRLSGRGRPGRHGRGRAGPGAGPSVRGRGRRGGPGGGGPFPASGRSAGRHPSSASSGPYLASGREDSDKKKKRRMLSMR